MDSVANEEQDGITATNIQRHVSTLEKRLSRNSQARLDYPDDPERWVKSEVDLDEQIHKFSDIGAQPELFPLFEELGGLRLLRDALIHPNIDIAISTLKVLSELIDVESLVRLKKAEHVLSVLEALSLHTHCAKVLLEIDEDAGELDYEGVKSAFELLENLLDLFPSIATDLGSNRPLLTFLLRRMKNSKTVEYDSNRVHACEILCILLQNSEECNSIVGGSDIGGIEKLLRIIAVFRKKDPEGVEEEELVENAFQCLCSLMLISTYRLAVTLLDYALMDCPENCHLFIKGMGLRCIFSILMGKGVRTKQSPADQKANDEHILGVLHSLVTNSSGNELARVINKFTEHKYEKLERLIEVHNKYTTLSRSASHSMESKDPTGEYLERYEAGLSVCQIADCILLRLYNLDNSNLRACIFLLLHNKGVDMQDIYENVSDYINHLDKDASETRETMDRLLKSFLIAASDSGLFK
eukprot:XP_001611666.1 hypothetical protein [Babesia bovis T2Bo]